MYLKQLQLKGFKSFAHKTVLEFSPGITVVVGPNGSGKSNIADAVRWVLGEQSARSLRGSKMEDVIFAGSKERQPVGMAQVSLILDNEDGELPLDFNEVGITRRVFRSGDSEFLINKAPCRLKDIHELFMDTGVGKESFSIIGQGKIAEILNSKPEERRSIIEEAAGISKYRYRQQQAVKKLESTEQSIHRLRDLVQEIDSQLVPLAEQAEQAAKYQGLKAQFDTLEIKAAVVEIGKLLEKITAASSDREQLVLRVKQREAENSVLEIDLEKQKFSLNRLDEEIGELQQRLYRQEQQLQRLEGSLGIEKEKQQHAKKRMEQLDEEQRRLLERKDRVQELIETIKAKQSDIYLELENVRRTIDETAAAYQGKIKRHADRNENAEQLKNQIFDLLHEESSIKNELARQDQNRQHFSAQQQRLAKQLDDIRQKLRKKEQELEQVAAEKVKNRQKEKNLENQLAVCEKQITSLAQETDQLQQRYRRITGEFNKATNRLETLEALSREYEGFYRGVREVLQAKESGKKGFAGIYGAVVQLLKVPEEYELAVETALGAAAQSVVVEDNKDAQRAIEFLKSTDGGRATFLPLDTIQPRLLPGKFNKLLSGPGIIGQVKDVIETQSKYRPVLEHLLGNVLIATDMEKAVAAARNSGFKVRVVTLDGDVVNTGGAMSGGSSSPKESGLIRREGEIKRLQRKQEQLSRQIRQVSQVFAEKRQQLDERVKEKAQIEQTLADTVKTLEALANSRLACTREIDNLKDMAENLNWQKEQLAEELSSLGAREAEFQEQLKQLQQRRADIEKELASLTRENQTLEVEKAALADKITGERVKFAALEQEQRAVNDNFSAQKKLLSDVSAEIAEKEEEKERLKQQEREIQQNLRNQGEESKKLVIMQEELQQEIIGFKERREQLKKEIGKLEETIKQNAKRLQLEQQELNQIEVKLARWETEKENHLSRLWESHRLSYEQALLLQEDRHEVKGLNSQLRVLRQQMEALGVVNLGAIEEYKRVSERHQFLTRQLADLQDAKKSLHKVIGEMQSIMKKRFSKTFARVNEYFIEMFRELFGGGTAELRLTEAEDVLEAGIAIIAQPPGKKLSHLSLLSGGEKALTAIALLFGILKVKPSPFCLLDEIDASLDEANVDRFASVLKTFAADSQFIVISHRQGTMEIADDLYGVTMDKSGISKLVSVKLAGSRVS